MSYPIDKEEQLVVVLALYILELLGDRKPKRMKVLRFIKSREMVRFYDDDTDVRSNGEEKWMNDFAWARQDVKARALLAMPEVGIWQITSRGREWLLDRAKNWVGVYEKNPESKAELLRGCRRFNETLFTHMIMLGRGHDIRNRPNLPLAPTATSVTSPAAQDTRQP